ncbi:MAG: oxidoreductase [Gammaproteobacteria bacterium]|nr:oxidoreductase [Gammaproteobacteria bacterium]MCY4356309.1 oxidoreductase [Gammaproteobacteria bacterium]
MRKQGKIGTSFKAKPEPSEILQGIDLSGKVAVVTGGYSGIGLETTKALAGAGVKVYVPTRDSSKAATNLAELAGEVISLPMDLASLDSVRHFAADFSEQESRLDLLINNAGIMACPQARLGNNWESQFAINHIGHFVLTSSLLPMLLKTESARVVSLSSIVHRQSDIIWDDIHFLNTEYNKWMAYAQAKTANALFALGLDMNYENEGLRAFSVHPGGILTPLQRHLPIQEMQALGWTDAEGKLTEQMVPLFKTPSQGCATTLWAATSPMLAEMGGLYCEDCDVANLATEDSPYHCDVAPWAINEESALRLLSVTEEMLA